MSVGKIQMLDGLVSTHCSSHWLSLLYLGGGFDGGSILEEELHHLDPVLLAGDMEGGEPVEGPGVRVSLAVQQELCNPDVPAVGSHVQGCQVVNGYFIHWGLVVKKNPIKNKIYCF
jgi:hypothetical protein